MRIFSNKTRIIHIRIDRYYRYLKNRRYILLTIDINIEKEIDR